MYFYYLNTWGLCKPPMLCLPRELWPWHQPAVERLPVLAPAQQHRRNWPTSFFAERTGQHLFMWYLLPYTWVRTKKIHIPLQLLLGSCSIKNNKSSRCWELTRLFCHIFAFTKASQGRGLEKGFSLGAGSVFLRSHFVSFLYIKYEILQELIKPS